MANDQLTVHWKTLDDALIASIRFVGQFDEIPRNFGRLVEAVEPHINGKAFALYHGGNPETGYDVEVCFPVSQRVEKGVIKSRVLEGEDVVCTIHRGPYRSDDEDKSIGTTWGKFWRHTVEHHIGIAENACREIYLEDDTDHGDDSESYVTEIMMPLLLPKWLARFDESLGQFAGDDVKREILEGSENILPQSDTNEKVTWVKGAMERLDAAVPDEDTRRKIVCRCAHIYPAEQIQKLKSRYDELGGIDPFMAWLKEDPGYGGAPYYRDPERRDDVIFIDKAPQQAAKHKEATDLVAKRAAACHCPVIKAAILAGEKISPTFCSCGTGWFKPLWETILERPVKITCEESVLQGHDRCKFAIHLNEES